MHKLSDKHLFQKVTPFFIICVVLLLYYWGVSTIVTSQTDTTSDENACNTEEQQETSDVSISIPPTKDVVIGAELDGLQQLEDSVQNGIDKMLRPTISLSPAESSAPQQTEEVQLPKVSSLDSRIPAVVYLRINPDDPKGPLLLSDERVSDDDIEIDISNAMNSDWYYTVPYDLEVCISRVVYREAGNQPMLGQLQVAEGVVTRIRSGVYGSDVPAILAQGYYVQTDSAGNYHVYHANGIEVIDVPEMATTVTKLALQGANTTSIVLEAGTALRNEQFGLELGEEYYNLGAFYHYSPDDVSEGALRSRVIGRVPVSYRYVDHVFYGRWLNANYALNIA